ncbi:hypothetical protein HXX76_011484 [Chlamydomonas incerta]|uniref:Kinesin motor domain-containing protein n=1 Tax=Chlamydomonas incerta TaxID=51695 RepID=A0A835SKP8_CHLIN|nr:hypothetical protein HXX76_011484 [Chlamydomonas incerta]|eukprot:KAG2428784.1 hypothetical protein HXX76_011484 [Chlamydomonas incerta]
MADQGAASRSIRVAVRVRPLLQSDGVTGTELLQLDRNNGVVLSSGSDRRGGRRYAFDSVFGPDVPQDDLYVRAGVPEMVAAAAAGFHATVFAYGQTGSGKTYTMEGYRYVGAAGAGGAGGAGSAAAGSAAGKAGAARSAPHADFTSTPEAQLGVIPRAVRDLFAAVQKSCDRRYTIKCSFVQIYREQVYDLLNPASLAPAAQQQQRQQQQRGGVAGGAGAAGAVGPLRLRWSKAEEFYLENLFTPEVETAEEAMAAFQAGVANKVMSSHRLNAASSRSHCLFTLHVSSSPSASALEMTSSRLTLVDLAGSERAAHTGATEGALRDESVAINKSLFTLRQVITALTDAAAAATAAAAAASGAASADGAPAQPASSQARPAGAPPAAPHIPYRDSKLTCLLKHSLGGNSWTLMLACLSPADRFYEENASTLDYAARARKITNQVAVNEDPRSRLIRELRAEVAFLRQQLEAAGLGAAAAAGADAAAGSGAGPRATATAAGSGARGAARGALAAGAASALGAGGVSGPGSGAGVGGLAAADEDDEAVARRLRTSDVEGLVRSVIEASRVAVSSSAALAGLRSAYARSSSALEALRVEHESLQAEDVRLRDRLALLESLVGATGAGGGGGIDILGGAGGGGGDGGGAYTASTAAFIELEELRRENALLHERLQLLDPGGAPPPPPRTPAGGGGGGLLGRSSGGGGGGGHASGRGTSRRPGTGASGGMPPRGSPAPSSPLSAASRGLNRAQSAGVLRASGRLPTAAASAAANPFTPREVLLAVGASGPGTGPGSFSGTGRPPLTAGGGSGRTLTVEQLRSVLQMGGGGAGSGPTGPPTEPGSPLPPQQQQHYAFADSRPSTSASALSGGTGSGTGGRLVELGHAVASRALASGVRLSTTGKLLPAAPARMAVEAGGGGGGGGLGGTAQRPGTGAGSFSFSQPGGYGGEGGGGALGAEGDGGMEVGGGGGWEREREPPLRTGSSSSGPGLPAEAAALSQLLAERNAMTRQRLGAG